MKRVYQNMDGAQKLFIVITTVLSVAVQLDSVRVSSSLCPTNKIAPHRKSVSWGKSNPRTLGLIYDFITPGRPRPPSLNDLDELVEKPQEEDSDDCGEIEDYDETDLSSITPGATNKVYYSNREHRYLFGHDYYVPSHYSESIGPTRPIHHSPSTFYKPQRPLYSPTKPSFALGGIFGSNVFSPPAQQYPSSHIKPVHEDTDDIPQTDYYRPGLIGGTLAQIVGFPPRGPTISHDDSTTTKRPISPIRFPDSDSYIRRHTRAKGPKLVTGIIGSFADLVFN